MDPDPARNDFGVIDRFTELFSRYIDSGFGLLGGEVGYLTSVLVAIDIALSGVFWALARDEDVIARLIRKTLYIGAFALMLNHWSWLCDIVFRSFAGLGLMAGNSQLAVDDLLRPGIIAETGFRAAWPLLAQAGSLLSFSGFFENLVTVLVLLLAWAIVVLAFFVLAIQLFVTIVEFKLTCLAGFVLVPFALWRRTAFLAERVLGHVVGSGIRMMVLAVILSIGTGIFSTLPVLPAEAAPDLRQAMALVLAATALFGIGIFAPSLAAGLTAGAPQLGAGAAMTTGGAVAGAALLSASAASGLARLGGQAGRTALQGASRILPGSPGNPSQGGMPPSPPDGAAPPRGGPPGPGPHRPSAGPLPGQVGAGPSPASTHNTRASHASASDASAPDASAPDVSASGASASGASASGVSASEPGPSADAVAAGGGPEGRTASDGSAAGAPTAQRMPAWAERLRDEQRRRARLLLAVQALREGDRPGYPAHPDLTQRD